LHFSENQLSKKGMILGILVYVTVIWCPVHGSLPITDHEYPLMHYTKLISDENFTAGLPLVIVLPLVEEAKTKGEIGYLMQELHTLSRWPILVFSLDYKIKENMDTEINQDGS
jgi:hypothetical protein